MEAEKSDVLSIDHFKEFQVAHEEALKNLPPIETPAENDDADLLLVKKFKALSRSWSRPLEDMMEDPQRRQRLKDMFPLLEDGELRQLLAEAQQDRQVCHLGGIRVNSVKSLSMRIFYYQVGYYDEKRMMIASCQSVGYYDEKLISPLKPVYLGLLYTHVIDPTCFAQDAVHHSKTELHPATSVSDDM